MSHVPPTLLIVDDDATARETLFQYMKESGFDVVAANGGRQALQVIESRSFDLILLDLLMPDVTGYDVLKTLRRSYSLLELPVIVVTDIEEAPDLVDALDLGANDYVIKPVDFELLKARAATQIALKNTEQGYRNVHQNLEQLVQQRTAELDRANRYIESERKRFKHILSSSPAITYVVGMRDGYIVNFVSENCLEQFGYEPGEVTGNVDFWDSHVHPEDLASGLADRISTNLKRGGGEVQYRLRRKNGDYRWVRDVHRVVYEKSMPVEVVGSLTDITETKQLATDLDYKNTHDALSGLINRAEFERRLQHTLEKIGSDAAEHVLCYMDLDQFKVINTTLGHAAGDELLRQLSKTLKEKLRRRDTVARLGGDEFGVLLEHCRLDQASRALNIIQDTLAEFRFRWGDKILPISASIGVVPINRHSESLAAIMSRADAACIEAKDAGRDRVHVYTELASGVDQRQEEMRWVERINRALEEDRFYLYCQAIVPILEEASAESHYELLIRMKGDNEEMLSPALFLPAAERYNLSAKIDRWVVQTALSWLEATPEVLARRLVCSINLSGQSLADENLLEFVIEQFKRKKIPAERICFEITETAAISHLENAIGFIKSLQDQGCKFALDDFGSGLSSFRYLKKMPVDFLKIDGAFVKNLAYDDSDLSIVKAINDVGKSLGKKTIAEFVENDHILQKLKMIGVDYAQGYGISKPKPLVELS